MTRLIISILIYSGFLISNPAQAQAQSLDRKDVINAMDSPKVKLAMNLCADGKYHPASVKLTIVILENGRMKLFSSKPAVTPELLTCFKKVIGSIRLPPPGGKYKMAYSFRLETWAQGGRKDGDSIRKPGDEPWNIKYRKSRKLVYSGIVFTVLGGGAILGLFFYVLPKVIFRAVLGDETVFDLPDGKTAAAILVPAFSSLVLGLGLLLPGVSKGKKANNRKKEYYTIKWGILPTILEKGAAISAVLRF